MKKQSFKQGISSVSFTHIIVFIMSFIMSILNARLLGPEGLGVLALLRSLQNFSIRYTDFGFSRAFRYYSANGMIPYCLLKKLVLLIGLIIGFVVVIISIVLKHLPINVWNQIDPIVYFVYLPTILFSVLIMYYRHLLHGQLLIMQVNLSNILEKGLYIVLFIVFVWYFKLGLVGVSISLTISNVFLFIQLYLKARKFEKLNIGLENAENFQNMSNIALIKKLFGYGQWSYYSIMVETAIKNFPVLFLKSKMDSFAQIGYFTKARGLAEHPRVGAPQLAGLLFSFNAGSSNENAVHRTEIMCRLSFWIVTLFYIGLSIFIKPIIRVLYGNEFLPAAEIFYYLYPATVLYIQNLFLSSTLAAKGFNKETFTIRFKSLPIVLLAAFLLISYFGIVGAAITISLSVSVLWVQYSRKYFKIFGSRFSKLVLIEKQDFDLIKLAFAKVIAKYEKRKMQ